MEAGSQTEPALVAAARRTGTLILFGVAPALAVVAFIAFTIGGSHPFYDFDGTLWQAGRAILHGRNPYPVHFLERLAAIKRAGGSPSLVYAVPLYPAPALLVFTPLSLLPLRTAGLVFTLISLAALIGGLRLLGVRDWRCHGAALLSWPVLQSLRLGTLNCLLLLGVAVLWRLRDRPVAAGAAAAAAASAKLFLWPAALWLVMVRRWRAVFAGVAVGVAAALAGWAVISFAGLTSYPGMLSDVSTVESAGGSSIIAAGTALGLSHPVSQAVLLLVSAALIAAAGLSAWRGADARRALALCVIASLTASPVEWPHYLTLAYVPIALISPELAWVWLLPLLSWLAPVELTHGDFWLIAPYLLVEAVLAWVLLRPGARSVRTGAAAPVENPLGAEGATVRLPHGLRSTSLRSNIAALRPTKGP